MIITHGNLQLRTITSGDLELLRQWRNSESVNRYLVYRDPISPGQQISWFESLDPSTSIYFLLSVNEEKVGLAYVHNIDQSEKSFEGSIFIGDTNYSDSYVPVKAALLLTKFFFEQLGFEISYSTVHADNVKALDLDRKLGYREISRQHPFIKSKCTKEDFISASGPIIKAFLNRENISFISEPSDKRHGFLQINNIFDWIRI